MIILHLFSQDAKKAELTLKITQVQSGVHDFTSNIDGMRVSRDRTLADIDLYERQSNVCLFSFFLLIR